MSYAQAAMVITEGDTEPRTKCYPSIHAQPSGHYVTVEIGSGELRGDLLAMERFADHLLSSIVRYKADHPDIEENAA